MKPTNQDINQLKKLFNQIQKNRHDPKKQALVEQARKEIDYNFKLFEIESDEDFAKDQCFCVECGVSLNSDNDCPSCGRAYGW